MLLTTAEQPRYKDHEKIKLQQSCSTTIELAHQSCKANCGFKTLESTKLIISSFCKASNELKLKEKMNCLLLVGNTILLNFGGFLRYIFNIYAFGEIKSTAKLIHSMYIFITH